MGANPGFLVPAKALPGTPGPLAMEWMKKRSPEEATRSIFVHSQRQNGNSSPDVWISSKKDLHMMKNLLKNALVVLGLALCTCTAAHAIAFRPAAPEVDPSLAIGGFTLLAGTLAVLRVRRKK
jgi:hypothetical protein